MPLYSKQINDVCVQTFAKKSGIWLKEPILNIRHIEKING